MESNGSVFITTACSAMSVAARIMLSVPYSLTKRLLFVLLHATYTQCHMRVAFKIMHEIYTRRVMMVDGGGCEIKHSDLSPVTH
jgi:hypothetical protein